MFGSDPPRDTRYKHPTLKLHGLMTLVTVHIYAALVAHWSWQVDGSGCRWLSVINSSCCWFFWASEWWPPDNCWSNTTLNFCYSDWLWEKQLPMCQKTYEHCKCVRVLSEEGFQHNEEYTSHLFRFIIYVYDLISSVTALKSDSSIEIRKCWPWG